MGARSPAVSVVIPTRNRSALLDDAVRSVLAQTLPAHEIIVVDDSSDAEHASRIRHVVQSSDRIHLFRLASHRGASAARNLGLENARGDFILFLDDDDLLHPRMLEASVHSLESNPTADIVSCLARGFIDQSLSARCLRLDERGREDEAARVSYPLSHPNHLKLRRVTFSDLLRYVFATNSCLIRRRCVTDVRFPEDLTAGEDTYFWLRLASQGCHFVVSPQFHAYVRYHGGSSQADPGHGEAVLRFCNKLLRSGMVRARRDRFIVHAYIGRLLLRMKRPAAVRHLGLALGQPDLVLQLLRFSYNGRQTRRLHRLLQHARLPVRK